MKPPRTLYAKLVLTATGLLLLALASIGLTLWVTWNLEGGAAAVNEAGRLRMQTYRLALALEAGDRDSAQALARGFDQSMALLAAGDPSRPLFVPWSPDSRARFGAVRARWQALRTQWLGGAAAADVRADSDAFVALVDGFVGDIEAQIARSTAILHFFQLALVALAIASAVVTFYAGYRFVLDPLARLGRGLAQVQAGELSTRIAVGSRDEFGELAAGFNAMAQTLQSLYEGLEGKVHEKTLRLEGERQRLADLYEVSAFVAAAPTLDALAQGFARQVRRIARADSAAVRWYDEPHGRSLTIAADPPGTAEAAAFASTVTVPVRLHDRTLAEIELSFLAATELGAGERELLDALAAHLASAMEGLRAAAVEREAAVAEERGLLARELHDSIAQSLAFLRIQVQLLRQAIQRHDQAALQRVAGELEAGVRESYADVRELLLHFRIRAREEDIEPALRSTLQKFEHQTGLPARLAMQGHGLPLAPDVQVQVLHILQEALSNVRKHAGARHVELRVAAAPHWRFEVRDDGTGFEPDDPKRPETHVGLRIMQERAQRIGAQVQVRSAPGAGCTVTLELPPARTEAGASAPAAVAA